MSKVFSQTLVALDLEATDISPEKGEIIEVAAVKYRQGKIVDTYHSLVKPRKKIPPLIRSIVNISDDMVKAAPAFDEIREEIIVFLDDFPLVGHNISFDINYLRANDVDLTNNVPLDTWRLSTIVYQGMRSFSLESLTARLGLAHKEKHRAEDDAKAGMDLFYHLVDKLQKMDPDVIREINEIASRSDWPLKEVFEKIMETMPTAAKLSTGRKFPIEPADDSDSDVKFSKTQLPKLLAREGAAKKKIAGYEYRPPQVEMMKYVAESFADSQFRLIETPPGVGKSMAYLLPAVTFAKANKEPVIISTHTRSLQDQLAKKDMATVASIVPFLFRTAVLKGRQQYLCRRLFMKLKKQASFLSDEVTTLAKLIVWVRQTKTGEFDELAMTREDQSVVRRLAADFHTCQGNHCPHRKDCFIKNARRRAKSADIIIVNHALLLREPKVENEPVLTAKRLIIDEAHELEEAATDAFSHSLTKEMVDEWLRKIANRRRKGGLLDVFPRRSLSKFLPEVSDLQQQVVLLENEIALFFGLVGMFAKRFEDGGKYMIHEVSLNADLRNQAEWVRLEEAGDNLIAKLGDLCGKLVTLTDKIEKAGRSVGKTKEWLGDIRGLCQAGKQLKDLFNEMFLEPRDDQVYWVTVRRDEKFTIKAAPLRVDERLQKDLYYDKKTVVLTSATLSTAMPHEDGRMAASFDYFKDRLGLIDFEFSRVASVFNYKKQALIYIPQDISRPNSPDYTQNIADVTRDIAKNLGGKTLILFTSYQGIKSVYNKIADSLKEEKIDVLAQGVTGGKMKLLQQFKESEHAVLLGTATFWQGIDIPGEKLSCLIMAKLPFSVPSEPVFKARQEEYDNGFTEYAVPLAILRFRQGFGRLIRTKKDRGVMVIMDSRVDQANYGLMFMRSLPESEVKYGRLNDVAQSTADWLAKKK